MLIILSRAWMCLLAGAVLLQAKPLIDLSPEGNGYSIELTGCCIAEYVDDGIEVMTDGTEEWPNVTFQSLDKPWNYKGSYVVKMDVENCSSSPVFVGIRLDAVAGESETPQHVQGFERFEPAESRTLTMRLTAEDWLFDSPLELVGMRRTPGSELIPVQAVEKIQIFSGHSNEPIRFRVCNLRVEGTVRTVSSRGFLPFVDGYGQYRHDDWPEKIHSDSDLRKARLQEAEALRKKPDIGNRSRFGGWATGPKLESTGYFRVEKVDGKWWFVDPEGYLFWSHGPNCIRPDFGYTGIEGREDYFEILPQAGSPLAAFVIDGTWAPHGFYADKIPFDLFQTYKANLYRKYGSEWEERFVDLAHRRLKSWGMNTIANWASPEVYLEERTAYVASFFIRGNRLLEGSSGYWGKFHDVFDPTFRETIKEQLNQYKAEAKDPWCIGFYVDNELAWGNDGISLAVATLLSPPDQPAKKVFLSDLKEKYTTVDQLNVAWGTTYRDWNAVLQGRMEPDLGRAGDDLKRFYRKTADTYFQVIQEELRKAAPNHLYLGCRFAWVNDLVADSASRYCDVVSYNSYEFSVRSLALPNYIDRPIIIGEYHFGATDRGHFHPGLCATDDQASRAEAFQDYVRSALLNPYLVGVHWFQYTDEHIAGRADGENYNTGLVDICDTPYPEMVAAMQKVGAQLYNLRLTTTQ
ncbi:MAG: beta-galactosidase [Coraliomargaritaceae bacterium]